MNWNVGAVNGALLLTRRGRSSSVDRCLNAKGHLLDLRGDFAGRGSSFVPIDPSLDLFEATKWHLGVLVQKWRRKEMF